MKKKTGNCIEKLAGGKSQTNSKSRRKVIILVLILICLLALLAVGYVWIKGVSETKSGGVKSQDGAYEKLDFGEAYEDVLAEVKADDYEDIVESDEAQSVTIYRQEDDGNLSRGVFQAGKMICLTDNTLMDTEDMKAEVYLLFANDQLVEVVYHVSYSKEERPELIDDTVKNLQSQFGTGQSKEADGITHQYWLDNDGISRMVEYGEEDSNYIVHYSAWDNRIFDGN